MESKPLLVVSFVAVYFEGANRFGIELLREDLIGTEECAGNDSEVISMPDEGDTGECEVQVEDFGLSVDNRCRDLLRYSRRDTCKYYNKN